MAFGPLNYLNVGPQGTFRKSGTVQSHPADVDALIAYLRASDAKKLTVHFHGGLIKEADGMKIAEKLTPTYEAAGSHALTFVWETGPLETIKDNLGRVAQSELFKLLLKKLLKKVLEKAAGSIGGKGPGGSLDEGEIEAELQRDSPFDSTTVAGGMRGGAAQLTETEADFSRQEIEEELQEELAADPNFERLLREEAPRTEFLETSKLQATPEQASKGVFTTTKAALLLSKIAFRVIKRFIQKRDHDFYPTVIEELFRELYFEAVGVWIWDGMKLAAKRMWAANTPDLSGDDLHAGTYFLEQISKLQRENGIKIDFVGHSAGSIAILELTAAAKASKSSIQIRSVFLLAPACTFKRFLQCVEAGEDRWQQLRVFSMADEFEKKDHLLGNLYTRSLLYFVSGLTEHTVDEPILGMDRFFSGQSPFDTPELVKVRSYLRDTTANRYAASVWSKVNAGAGEGFRTSSETHGNFDDDADTLASLQFLIRQ